MMPANKKKYCILYVEDEQWAMSGIVDDLMMDYSVVTARNGDQALSIIESGEYKIDLILLDIMIPSGERVHNSHRGRRTGVELAKIILEEKMMKIPIVCYTIVTDREVYDELIKLGVKEVVSKKKLPSELELIIKKYLC